jgi:hypothetical protein
MSSMQGVGHAKIVGAPTLAQALRLEAFLLGGMVVAPGTKTLTPNSGELLNLAIGQNSGRSNNVGAPTLLDSPRVVRP